MSTKTIFKRIALTAVSALAAGSLTVISVPAANAAAADGDIDAIRSVGLVGAVTPSLTAHNDGSTTRTAVLLKTGSISVSLQATGVTKVSAGAIISRQEGATGETASASSSINGSQNCAISVAADYNVIVPTGAAGTTFTITTYSENTCETAATIGDVITVTIAASNLAGAPSAADSTIRWDDGNSGSAPTASEDATNASTTTGSTLKLYMNIADAYGQDISDTTGALVVSVSSGAYLGTIAASGNAAAPASTATTQVSTADPSALWVYVGEATSGAGWSGTVTVSYNGVVLATKTGKITGAPASITVSPYKVAKTSSSNPDPAWLYIVKDAAGNGLAYTSSNIVLDTSSNSAVVSDAAGGTTNAAFGGAYGDYVGTGTLTCTSTGGSSTVVVKTTLSNGTVVKSNPFTALCGGDATSYSASFDKAEYIQGEVATMTIVFKDSRGNLANSHTSVDTATTAEGSISAPMMSIVGSLGTAGSIKVDGAGKLTYKFTVGTSSGLTAGSYNAVVSWPKLAATQGAVSVPYKVSTGATSVTNAEVLAAIVKLIASINKQIRALQKKIRG